jgi:hypothetical protein
MLRGCGCLGVCLTGAGWVAGAVLDLDVIGTEDAVALLRTRVPALEQETGELIAEELERLPLALEQAAAYMDQAQVPAGEYLDLERALAITEAAYGPDHPGVAILLNNLAVILRDLGLTGCSGTHGGWPSGRWPSTRQLPLGPAKPADLAFGGFHSMNVASIMSRRTGPDFAWMVTR